MSNRQLGWDDQRIRDRLSPREIDQVNNEEYNEQEAQQGPEDNKDRVVDSNPHTHSKQSDK